MKRLLHTKPKLSALEYSQSLMEPHPECRWFPCGGVPAHWLWTKPGWSCPLQRPCTCSGSQTGSRAHGTRILATAESTSHYLQHTARNTVTCWHNHLQNEPCVYLKIQCNHLMSERKGFILILNKRSRICSELLMARWEETRQEERRRESLTLQ